MIKSIALMANDSHYFTVKRLIEEIQKRNIKTNFISTKDISLRLNKNNALLNDCQLLLHRSTGVNFDHIDLVLLEIAKAKEIPCSNPLTLIEKFKNKDRQIVLLDNLNLKPVPSMIIRGKNWMDLGELGDFEKFVVKTVRGNKGLGVIKIVGKDSLESLLESQWACSDQRYIIQPYLDIEREYRSIMIGPKSEVVIEKLQGNSFKKNSTYSQFKNCTSPPQEVKNLISLAENKLNSHFAALDIAVCDQGVFLLEVNLIPGLEMIEAASHKNLAGPYIDWCIESL